MTSESEQSSDSPAREVSSTRLRWWGTLRVLGTLSFVAAVFVGVTDGFGQNSDDAFGWVTIVIGNWVPTWWTLELALVGTGTVALIAAMIIVPFPPARPGRGLRALVTVVLVLTVPLCVLGVGLGTPKYTVLQEQSDGGCRVVVREYSFLLMGQGSAGIVQPGSMTVEWLGEYWADDGYMPFSGDTYSLDWNGTDGDLEVFSESANWAAWAGDKPTITCVR